MGNLSKDSLGDRMKGYEEPWRFTLPRRQPVIVRIDGRAFHTYLRGADKPFDAMFSQQMGSVCATLCMQLSGAVFAYQQSDEISVLMQDWATSNTQPFLGGVIQKLTSISASIATAQLTALRTGTMPTFDARVFALPSRMETANYFIWRQRDAERNSIMSAGRAHFSHAQLHGKSTRQIVDMLWTQHHVSWDDYSSTFKYGQVVTKHLGLLGTLDYSIGGETVTVQAIRSEWAIEAATRFNSTPGHFLDRIIPPMDDLSREDTAASE